MKYKSFFAAILFTAILFVTGPVYPAGHKKIDVVLVMDSSGSMKKTDPQSLRIPAAKLFISLLKESDRAGVISFSEKSRPLIDLTSVDSDVNKDKLFEAAEKITSDGAYTNLYDALAKGAEVISADKQEGRTGIIVLMSDGMMDVGDPLEDMRLSDLMRDELASTLEEGGTKVYTIAFTSQSDRKLLEKISKRTGGFYNLALTDQELHVIFTSIFESLKSPEMLPMSKNGFTIDKSVEEVTIVATKGAEGTKIMLNAPDGHSYTSDNKGPHIEWFASSTFDMITARYPAAGRWEILFSSGENNKAYVITDLKLQTNFDKLYSTYGDPLDVEVWLEKEGKKLSEQDVIDKIDIIMELTAPDGRTANLNPFKREDGTYLRRIAPFKPGNYKLRIIARGKTFEREKDFVFNVADVKESKEDVQLEREKKKKLEEEAKIVIPVEENPVEENKDRVAWGEIIIHFLIINFVIGLAALVYFKRKKLKTFKPLKLKKHKSQDDQNTSVVPARQAPDENKATTPAENDASPPRQPEPAKIQPVEAEINEKSIEPQDTQNDKEIALDDDDMENNEVPSKPESPARDKIDEQGSVEEKPPAVSSTEQGPETIQENEEQAIINQSDLDNLLAGEAAEEIEDNQTSEKVQAQPVEPAQAEDSQDDFIRTEVDGEDILADAFQETNDSTESSGPEYNTDIIDQGDLDALFGGAKETDIESSENIIDEEAKINEPLSEEAQDESNIDDMWAEAFKEEEQKQDADQTAEEETPVHEEPPAALETASEVPEPGNEPLSGEAQDESNIDDMWAEAFKEAEGQADSNKKADVVSNKTDTGEEPVNG